MGLLGDVRPGMLPVVEIPGTAFHLAGASQVRVLTSAAMAMVPAPPPGGPHLMLGPYVEGAAEETELVRPRNLQLLPNKYASLLLDGDGLSPLRAYHVLHASIARNDELEADLIGMELAARAGYDPQAAVRVMEAMDAQTANEPKPPAMLSTHPSGPERIIQLMDAMPKALAEQQKSSAVTGPIILK